MMNFDEFLEAAKNHVQESIPDAQVKIQSVEKLQGESYTGISVRPEGGIAAVTFNIMPAFESYQKDESQEGAVLDRIVAEAIKVSADIPAFELSSITDYEVAKDNLLMQVVPVEQNKEMLEGIPHKTIGDIAVVYRIELPGDAEKSATTLVTNHLLEEYGVSANELHADAVIAQSVNHPPVLKNMAEVVAKMSGGMLDMPESPLWVATVEGGVDGASVVQIPEFLDEVADLLGGDFFVLPSSVHEVLFIRDDGSQEREQLEGMVREINATEVSEVDFLSNSIYHYDSEDHVFEKAADFESRVTGEMGINDAEPTKDTITVLLVEPNQHPRAVELGTELEDLQNAVGGYIEAVYPFDEPVALIVNEEGKLDGLPLNRALRDDDGEIYDIIAGPFLVVGLTEDDFGSLTPEQIKSFEEKYHSPEAFVQMGRRIMAVPIPDEKVEKQNELKVAAPELKAAKGVKEESL